MRISIIKELVEETIDAKNLEIYESEGRQIYYKTDEELIKYQQLKTDFSQLKREWVHIQEMLSKWQEIEEKHEKDNVVYGNYDFSQLKRGMNDNRKNKIHMRKKRRF